MIAGYQDARYVEMLSKQQRASYAALRAIVDPWKKLGWVQLPMGTECIGHTPQNAPLAYLHRLLPPLDDEGLNELEHRLGRSLSSSLGDFYRLHNGLNLFDLHITIDGFRRAIRRSDIDFMREQPYDLVLESIVRKPQDAPKDSLVIGSLGDERDAVVLDTDQTISIWDKKSGRVTSKTYKDLFSFLHREAEIANVLFDASGNQIEG